MRRVVALLALVACGDKKTPPPPALGSGAASVARDGGAIDARVVAGPVELLHTYLSFVDVSSHVMNRTIKPEHIADRDFNTAWNSKTGELVGTWIDVRIPSAQIQDLRLTVGHTGKGPKGEDYFTMNRGSRRSRFSTVTRVSSRSYSIRTTASSSGSHYRGR